MLSIFIQMKSRSIQFTNFLNNTINIINASSFELPYKTNPIHFNLQNIQFRMQIDNTNFQNQKPFIISNIRNSTFLAFDFQFTGLTTDPPASQQNQFQDEQEHYQRVKQVCVNFAAIQFGITCYKYEDGVYKTNCYNFFIRNPSKGKNHRNLFICDIDSMEFLASSQMDFKRVFLYGIPSRRLSEKKAIMQQISLKQQNIQMELQFLSEQDEKRRKQVEDNLLKFYKQEGETIINFHNKTVLESIQKIYNITLEDKSENSELKQCQRIVRFSKGLKQCKNKEDLQQQEQKSLDSIKLQKLVQIELGISELIHEIIKQKVPIVGHFLHLDLGFLYHLYVDELPDSVQQFQNQVTKYFPYIFDTKVISKVVQKNIKGLKVDLQGLNKSCLNYNQLGRFNNVIEPNVNKYSQQKYSHEAGYDSYITGLAFVCMCNFLRTEKPIQIKKKKSKKQLQQNVVQLQVKEKPKFPNLVFEQLPLNHVLYSKAMGDVFLNNLSRIYSLKNQELLVINNGLENSEDSIKEVGQILRKYGTIKICIRDKIYIKFFQHQNIQKIIDQNPKLSLTSYASRTIFKSTQFL